MTVNRLMVDSNWNALKKSMKQISIRNEIPKHVTIDHLKKSVVYPIGVNEHNKNYIEGSETTNSINGSLLALFPTIGSNSMFVYLFV